MLKVLFLNIDGVLNSRSWYCRMDKEMLKDQYGHAFDPIAVANLTKAVGHPDVEIVLSSSWKFFGLDGIQEMWRLRKLPGKVIDITPNVLDSEMLPKADSEQLAFMTSKGYEINEWLRLHRHKIASYTIVDDENDMLEEQQKYFVQTDPEIGLTEKDAEKNIELLK